LESLAESFPLILANLRFPTLLRLSSKISTLCEPTGVLVLSGFRPEEFPDLLKAYEKGGFEETWHGEEKNWGGMVLKKNG
jgi:ribosomal protein L11 methylase PrmA